MFSPENDHTTNLQRRRNRLEIVKGVKENPLDKGVVDVERATLEPGCVAHRSLWVRLSSRKQKQKREGRRKRENQMYNLEPDEERVVGALERVARRRIAEHVAEQRARDGARAALEIVAQGVDQRQATERATQPEDLKSAPIKLGKMI